MDDEHLNGLILAKVLQILMHCTHHGDFDRMEHKIIDFLDKFPHRPGVEIRVMIMKHTFPTFFSAFFTNYYSLKNICDSFPVLFLFRGIIGLKLNLGSI
ncbi:MAG: hypothetical protein U9O87_06680 [Verrucomicrobiota bacterium]|nr:hypothetical protein [Verrucomicrobiota bacterium]